MIHFHFQNPLIIDNPRSSLKVNAESKVGIKFVVTCKFIWRASNMEIFQDVVEFSKMIVVNEWLEGFLGSCGFNIVL